MRPKEYSVSNFNFAIGSWLSKYFL